MGWPGLGFGMGPPNMSLPLGEYRICTACGGLRGWLIIMPKLVGGPTELLARLDDPDTVVLCTRCSRGRVSGLTPEYIKKSEPRTIPFWKYLKDDSFVVKKIEIDAKEAIDGRGLTPYDFIVKINGEVVERLRQLEMSAWIGEPGVELALTFVHHIFDDEGNLKELKHEKLQLDKERIKGLSFNLMKIDDIAEEKANGEKKAIPTDVQT